MPMRPHVYIQHRDQQSKKVYLYRQTFEHVYRTVSLSKTEIGCLLERDRVRNLSQRSIVCNCAGIRVLMCVQHSMSDLHKDTQF